MSFYVSTAIFFLLHCDEWDRVVALPRHKFVTGATLLQLVSEKRCGQLHMLQLRKKLYDKRYDYNFLIVNFPFISSNIPAAPAYGIYISQLKQYSRACGSYQDFLDRGLLLTRKLLNQGFLLDKLKSSLQKCYGRHHDGISVSQMTTDMFHLSLIWYVHVCFVDHCVYFFFWSLYCLFFDMSKNMVFEPFLITIENW